MTIKSTALTDCPTAAYEREQQLFKLKAELDKAEQQRLSGAPMISLEEARERLKKKYIIDIV